MATASLGRLTLDLVARTASFVEPLSQAERKARSSGKGIKDSMDLASLAVKGLGIAVGGLSIASLVAFSGRIIETGNDIQKFSKLSNSSIQQFQYYAKGAETAGISIESFADKMKDMQDRIGDFQQTGGGPLADFFTNIAPLVGVSIKQFQKLSGPEALQLFYNSLDKAGASTNAMKFYMEQIISDSSLLIPLLEKNGEGFKFWGDKAKEAGAIMSNDMVNSLAEAKKNLMLMDFQWQGLEAQLVNGVIPVFKTVAENLDTIKAIAVATAAAIGSKLILQAGYLSGVFIRAAFQAGIAEYQLLKLQGATLRTASAMGILRGITSLLGGPIGLAMLAMQIAVAGTAYFAMTRDAKNATEALEEQGMTVDELRKKYQKMTAAQLALKSIEATDIIKQETGRISSYTGAIQQIIDELRTEGDIRQSDALQVYLTRLKVGGDQAKIAFAELQKQGLVDESNIRKMASLDEKIANANKSIERQKEIQELTKKATDDATKSQEAQTRIVNKQAEAFINLTQKQREYIKSAQQDAARQKYVQDTMRLGGWSKDQAEFFADAQVNANGEDAFKKALPNLVLQSALKSFNSKNYSFTKSDLAAISRTLGIAKANNFAQIEGLYGLPSGTLAALVLQESRGISSATSPTGAKGLFQTTSIFRKQYGLNSNSSIEAQATAAAKDISKNLRAFGSLEKALMAYNAGAGGLQDYLAGGLNPSKRSEVAGYVPGFQKWFAGVNDKTSIDNSILTPSLSDILQQNSKAAEAAFNLSEERKRIDAQYFTESEKLAKEHQERLEKITAAFTGTKELKNRIAQENAYFKDQSVQLQVDKEREVSQLKAFETDRITQIRTNFEEEIRLTQASTKFGEKERATRVAILQRSRKAEIDAIKREEDEQVQSAFEMYLNETEIVVKRYQREREEIQKNYQLSKETRKQLLQSKDMGIFGAINQAADNVLQRYKDSVDYLFQFNNPNAFAHYNLQNQYSLASGGLEQDYRNQVDGINLLKNEEEKNSQLLAAHEQYLQAKEALNNEYATREQELNLFLMDNQLSTLNTLIGSASGLFSSITSMAKDAYGEQSASYKMMFLMQQAFAMASATVSAFQAYGQILASPWYLDVVSKTSAANLVLGMGMANVGLIAGQTIAGMAHNGIDNIPKEGTWLLDGGERVLNPKQNKDLTNYLDSNQNGGGKVDITVNVTDSGVSTNGSNTENQRQLGQLIGNTVRAVIRQEQKQGGLLAK
ncbi:hypothetical protein F889_02183 [Acinetobacter colistiniresistens]|uniref:Transglycosylase SLT domain-containing protein n=1 Tax=Acinetobacter colistiniresistens TaxID=280145 RepID=N9R308_9GAMM|nr:transglycosylase SLT domain-containing protein [Acinetobacter colistiniresistens]ENX33522.1 hypothetical protein F889_02183 [Acinetobacter colistiniresistens]